ncbi:hypothetical protein Dsin_007639 [Dipteronia sinensis]|uniref:Uncharacterized protein n=1 Tax=Dipteronia sinensis TaxID=43782 RepID=A0AAE0B0Z4_9ROSI|nr:hypothetical protein Dsin_007639 [Dipteronia sinensis]
MKRNKAFSDIQNYLSTQATLQASRFKADVVKGSKSLILTMEDQEEVPDEFNDIDCSLDLTGQRVKHKKKAEDNNNKKQETDPIKKNEKEESDNKSSESYAKIESLLAEINMTPADVAENMMMKSDEEDEVETCLNSLIEALEDLKKKP